MKRFPLVLAVIVAVIALIAFLAIRDSDSDVDTPYGGTYDRRGSYETSGDIDVEGAEFSDTGDALDPSGARGDSVPLRPGEVRVGSGLVPATNDPEALDGDRYNSPDDGGYQAPGGDEYDGAMESGGY